LYAANGVDRVDAAATVAPAFSRGGGPWTPFAPADAVAAGSAVDLSGCSGYGAYAGAGGCFVRPPRGVPPPAGAPGPGDKLRLLFDLGAPALVGRVALSTMGLSDIDCTAVKARVTVAFTDAAGAPASSPAVDLSAIPEGLVCPLRGDAGWLDSDTTPAIVRELASPTPLVVHAATQAGTRSTTRPNQDAFGVALGVCSPGVLLATLLDGHGPDGHFISRHVRDRLPAWAASCEPPADDSASPPSPVVVIPPGFQPPPAWQSRCARAMALDASGSLSRASASGPRWASALPAAFLLLDNDLCSGRSSLLQASRATPEHSGCACVCAMLGEGHLAVAGCGDSAAFLAQRRPDGRCPTDAHRRSIRD
jgi:serine/threonine protein phosphatase PrpC